MPRGVLLEREAELAEIEAALRAAVAGEGGLAIVEGEAGAGKTALLEAGARLAAELGVDALRARGGEYERDFPYGVVRQLFEPRIAAGDGVRLAGSAAMAAPAFAGTGAEDPFSIQHGLYWLAAELAEPAPLLLVVDDAQWADAASLQALLYIARRLEGMRVALLLALRTGEPAAGEATIGALRAELGVCPIRPTPLSVPAVAALASERAAGSPSEAFAAACREATGGNPFLLSQLLRALAEEDDADFTAAGSPERLARLAARGAAPAILARLARFGAAEAEVARAVAILEPRAEVRLVAALSGRPAVEVVAAGARLAAASLFADGPLLAFSHPLVREAVLSEMGESTRRGARARAARLLADDGAEPDTVAAHLLLAEPAGDEWVVEWLRGAAATAMGRGAPATATGYLRRALAEPPPDAERIEIERELGLALLRNDDEAGIPVLEAVHARAPTLERRAEAAAALANSLMFRGRPGEAEAILIAALEQRRRLSAGVGTSLRLQLLLATLAGVEQLREEHLPAPGDTLVGDTVEGRAILSYAALYFALGAGPMARVMPLIERIGADAEQAEADARAGYGGNPHQLALSLLDRGELALELFASIQAGAEARGTLSGVTGVYGSRAYCHFCDGQLSEAQVDAETALRISVEAGFRTPLMSWLGILAPAMTARGEAAEAVARIDRWREELGTPPGLPGALASIGRGQALGALQRHAEAVEDFRAAAARLEWLPLVNPEALGWRPGLALSLAALGETEEAERVAVECLALAEEADGPRGIGIALRVSGLVGGGEGGIEELRRSAELLGATRARLQHAESLVELGAALRRANRRREAREPLAEGLEIAHRCGAAPLAERARTELAAAGARPRNVVRSGVDALTPSELRVARLAAEGRTNREIAQALTVTPKTVETHLRHVFQKLDVGRRTELPGALGESGPA